MPKHAFYADTVLLKEDVKKGQAVSLTGKLATSGSGTDEPAGVAQYDGVAGEHISITIIGVEEITVTGVAVGGGVTVSSGDFAAATGASFGIVRSVSGSRAEVILGTSIAPSTAPSN